MKTILLCFALLLCVTERSTPPTFIRSDIYLLASMTETECGNCSSFEKYLVASTALNRIVAPEFPNDLLSVLTQPHQYVIRQQPSDQTLWLVNSMIRYDTYDRKVLYFYHRNNSFAKQMSSRVVYHLKHHDYAR